MISAPIQVLPRYIVRQITAPFLMSAVTLIGVIWLIRTLPLLDVVVIQGQSAGVVLRLMTLLLPWVLSTVLPVSLFCAVLYALHRLHSDSELVVMFSAGLSRWSVARPILAVAATAAVAVLLLNLYATPLGFRAFRTLTLEIRADIASTMVRAGHFTNPVSGVTVYVRGRDHDGTIHDIFVQDARDRTRPVTYMARQGALVSTPEGPQLIMLNGNIQYGASPGGTGAVSTLFFDRYEFDVSQLMEEQDRLYYDSKELFLRELLFPDPENPHQSRNAGEFRAEAHDRLSSPLFCLAYALIALAAMSGARSNRFGHARHITVAVTAAVLLRIASFGVLNGAVAQPLLIPLLYLLPLGASAVSAAVISDVRFPAAWIPRKSAGSPDS